MTPDLRRRLRALAEHIVGERPDAFLLVPMLLHSLSLTVQDFVKYHPVELAQRRVRDHQILSADPIAKRKTTRETDQARVVSQW